MKSKWQELAEKCDFELAKLRNDHEAMKMSLSQAEKREREQRAGRDHILSLLRSTKERHGACYPRKRKACRACIAQEELDKILLEWR